ncbi:uncharacterized protein LOC115588301 [Sparus aurata]|uniref:uncharacterized protein LOC115588301 n=1 Tax=Sparus aurata TaxID=8175 RepID=UPI0011C12B76|nr:uncharacterized protein LOC115588301 [Sparus aurata]
MRGAVMSLPAAASGLVFLLLTVPVIQGKDDWGVTYSFTEICALKGSTVDLSCTYTYPSTVKRVKNRFWFTKVSNGLYTDLRTDPEYSGRVQYNFGNNDCTLRITDLRESDSAEYKFRFTTNEPGGGYTGSPGVTLSVTDLQVRVDRSHVFPSELWARLMCHSSCRLRGRLLYVWYKNRRIIQGQTSSYYSDSITPTDSFSCAVEGHENLRSRPLCELTYLVEPFKPTCYPVRVPSVSVTLTCSSDANPAANYTWYKENEDSPKASGQIFTITDFRSEHRGNYSCESQNRRGRNKTTVHLTVVSGSGKSVAAGAITVVLLAIISLSVFLWIRKKRASRESTEAEERPDDREQGQPEEQGDFHYASVHFSNIQAVNPSSNFRPAQPRRHVEQQDVEYAAVRFNSASTALSQRSGSCRGSSCVVQHRQQNPLTCIYSLKFLFFHNIVIKAGICNRDNYIS